MGKQKWHSLIGLLYHILGGAFYLYHWLLIVGIASMVSSVVAYAYTPIGKLPTALLLFQLGLALVVVGVVAALLRYRQSSQILNQGLVVLDAEDLYQWTATGEYTYTNRILVQARYPGIDSYYRKFKWTGEGAMSISTPTVGCSVVHQELTGEPWDRLVIRFPNRLDKHTKYRFEVTVKFVLSGKKPHPILQRTIDDLYPGVLLMRVIPPAGDDLSQAKTEMFLSARADRAIVESQLTPDPATGEVRWHIRRPRLGRRYRISW